MKTNKVSEGVKKAVKVSVVVAVVVLGIALAPYIDGWNPVRCQVGALLLCCAHFLGALDTGEDALSEEG